VATIRTNCTSGCGEVDLPASDVTIDVMAHEYRFVCPQCDLFVTKPMDAHIEDILTMAGAVPAPTMPDPDAFAYALTTKNGDELLRRWMSGGDA
jgi:hypothetical protein